MWVYKIVSECLVCFPELIGVRLKLCKIHFINKITIFCVFQNSTNWYQSLSSTKTQHNLSFLIFLCMFRKLKHLFFVPFRLLVDNAGVSIFPIFLYVCENHSWGPRGLNISTISDNFISRFWIYRGTWKSL